MGAEIQELAVRQAAVCALFGNARRILILWALLEQEMTVSDIASAIEASLQSTSQYLRLMEDRGVLLSRREGQNIYYRLANHDLLEGCRLLYQVPDPGK